MAISLEEQVGWYEATLPLKERKSRGHFSTPPHLVEQILDACGYTPDHDLTSIRVLDPACGSGNFLAGAAHRLASFATQADLAQEELAALIQRNVWGLDPDPVSCFLAEMQLSTIACSPLPLHIQQADGLALYWGNEPRVDLFLANPPYLAAKNTDLSGYRSTHQRGQADSYLLFLSLGLQIVRPLGWIGLVLPDPVLARTNAARERARLLQEFTVHHLWHLSGVFAAQVGAVVIIAQKKSSQSTHYISWVREKWGKENDLVSDFLAPGGGQEIRNQVVPQSLFLRQPGAEFRYLLSGEQDPSIERLRAYFDETSTAHRRLAPLGEFLLISRGEELGTRSSLLVRQNQIYKEDRAPGGDENQVVYPVLRGGRDIRPYATSFSGWWIAREAITKPIERYLSPKLLVVKSTDRLQAALDMQGHIALQTLYLLHLRTKETNSDDLYFFLALLNSSLLRKYVYVLHTAYKWVQPQIEQYVLAHLPIPIVATDEKQQIIERAKLLEATVRTKLLEATVGADLSRPSPIYRPSLPTLACSELEVVVEWNESIQSLYEEQECAICALYDAALDV